MDPQEVESETRRGYVEGYEWSKNLSASAEDIHGLRELVATIMGSNPNDSASIPHIEADPLFDKLPPFLIDLAQKQHTPDKRFWLFLRGIGFFQWLKTLSDALRGGHTE